MTALLEVEGLSKRFDGVAAVDGVSFQVARGEILGVIGPNGSGKSTLFNCVLGQLRPSAGEVRLDGRRITGLPPDRLSRLGVGRTFQLLQVFGGLSVRDNLLAAGQEHVGGMVSRLFGRSDAGLGSRAAAIIEQFRLTAVAEQPAAQCSYGQQKLLDLAMALMPSPRLLLLDEPAGGVNPALLDDLHARLRALNREDGVTLVVIEHNMEFVMSLCDRILVLAEGRVLREGTAAEVQADPEVIEAYLGG